MSLQNRNLVHAMCQVTAQVGPVFSKNRGFSAVVRNGAGDYTLTLEQEVDLTEAEIFVGHDGASAASGMTSFGTARPADGTIRVTSLQEAGGGGASVLTDVDFQVLVGRLPTGN